MATGKGGGATRCNICGSTKWKPDPWKRLLKCASCGSKPRHRNCLLVIDHVVKPAFGSNVLHFAPERGLYEAIASRVGTPSYDLRDFNPERLAKVLGVPVGQFDLCKDTFELPEGKYDLIIHNHVLEHVPCNYTSVLHGLRRALRPGGFQIFTVPMISGYYREDTNPTLPLPYRTRVFKQVDHLRMFGKEDFDDSLGRAIGLTKDYALADFIPAEALTAANIPQDYWRGVSGSSTLVLRK